MREVGSPSWRFADDIDQSLHVVLYLRDALGLEIEGDPIAPPRLAHEIADRSELLDPASTRAATAQWPPWWRALVELQVEALLGSSSEQAGQRVWGGQLAGRRRLVFDPPDWSSLADSPALQRAARALWREGCEWFELARKPHLPPAGHEVFAWPQVCDGAERAAIEHDVSPGAVNGCAQVLMVEGSWWQVVAPGAAVCSVAAACDPETIAIILADVFDSYLTN